MNVALNRSSSSRLPRKSPWGDVQQCEVMYEGVFAVKTMTHGGIMIRDAAVGFLSNAAKKCGFRRSGYLCFDKDNGEYVAIRELLDQRLWDIPDYIGDMARFVDDVNTALQQLQPDYWKSRQEAMAINDDAENNSVADEQSKSTLAERLEVGKSKATVHQAVQTARGTPAALH